MTNGKKFSYPGYNEILTGAPDPRVDSNDKKPNANVTVFEWLNGRSGLRNRVAVFGTWDVFPYIFNIERSHLPIWPVWESKFGRYEIPPPQFVADLLRDTTPVWEDVTYDSFLFHATVDYLKRQQPRYDDGIKLGSWNAAPSVFRYAMVWFAVAEIAQLRHLLIHRYKCRFFWRGRREDKSAVEQ